MFENTDPGLRDMSRKSVEADVNRKFDMLYIANCVCKSMINKREISLPVVYSRSFASKAVF